MKKINWQNLSNPGSKRYLCGHAGCNVQVASENGYSANAFLLQTQHNTLKNITALAKIYICPSCNKPTYFEEYYSSKSAPISLPEKIQIPGVAIGLDVKHLPSEISSLYNEIRNATSQDASTLAILGCRKLLMHIAAEQGAEKNLSFAKYVDYLVDKGFAPPNSKSWIDKIRSKGNEANHEINIMTKSDAQEIITFIGSLLQFIYGFPGEATQTS